MRATAAVAAAAAKLGDPEDRPVPRARARKQEVAGRRNGGRGRPCPGVLTNGGADGLNYVAIYSAIYNTMPSRKFF